MYELLNLASYAPSCCARVLTERRGYALRQRRLRVEANELHVPTYQSKLASGQAALIINNRYI